MATNLGLGRVSKGLCRKCQPVGNQKVPSSELGRYTYLTKYAGTGVIVQTDTTTAPNDLRTSQKRPAFSSSTPTSPKLPKKARYGKCNNPLPRQQQGCGKNTAKNNAIYNSSNSNEARPLLLLIRRAPVLAQVRFGFLDAGEYLLKEGLVLRLLQVIHRAARFR